MQKEKAKEWPPPSKFRIFSRHPLLCRNFSWLERGGMCVQVVVKGSFNEPQFPNFQAGDSVELFFDTRDVKTSGFNTKFCHHFYFLPEAIENEGEAIQAGEATRFRTEDVHELCSPQLLEVKTTKGGKEVKMDIFIPKECLHGYDPSLFERLGFTYRINRASDHTNFLQQMERTLRSNSNPLFGLA